MFKHIECNNLNVMSKSLFLLLRPDVKTNCQVFTEFLTENWGKLSFGILQVILLAGNIYLAHNGSESSKRLLEEGVMNIPALITKKTIGLYNCLIWFKKKLQSTWTNWDTYLFTFKTFSLFDILKLLTLFPQLQTKMTKLNFTILT